MDVSMSDASPNGRVIMNINASTYKFEYEQVGIWLSEGEFKVEFEWDEVEKIWGEFLENFGQNLNKICEILCKASLAESMLDLQ